VLRVSDLHEQEETPVMPKFRIMRRKPDSQPDMLLCYNNSHNAIQSTQATTEPVGVQDALTEEKKLEERHEAYAKVSIHILLLFRYVTMW